MLRRLQDRRRDVRTLHRLLTTAEEHARADGQPEPGAEHLLLAACELPDGTAAQVLAVAGLDAQGLWDAVAAQHAAALADTGHHGEEPSTTATPPRPRWRYAAQGSLTATLERLHAHTNDDVLPLLGAHVVVAATTPAHGTVARALAHAGVDRDGLRTAAQQLLAARRGG